MLEVYQKFDRDDFRHVQRDVQNLHHVVRALEKRVEKDARVPLKTMLELGELLKAKTAELQNLLDEAKTDYWAEAVSVSQEMDEGRPPVRGEERYDILSLSDVNRVGDPALVYASLHNEENDIHSRSCYLINKHWVRGDKMRVLKDVEKPGKLTSLHRVMMDSA